MTREVCGVEGELTDVFFLRQEIRICLIVTGLLTTEGEIVQKRGRKVPLKVNREWDPK